MDHQHVDSEVEHQEPDRPAAGRMAAPGRKRLPLFRRLQRAFGNQVIQRVVQSKLTTGQSLDTDEPESASAERTGQEHPYVAAALRQRGYGRPLPGSLRREMEGKMGASFDGVRIHTDALADQAASALQARAFTVGEDIFFARGAFAPEDAAGQELLGHELAHVAQAYQGRVGNRPSRSGGISHPADPLELEAEVVGRQVAGGESPRWDHSEISGTPILREEDEQQLNSQEYVTANAAKLAGDLMAQMAQVDLATGSSYATWKAGSSRAFIQATMKPITGAGNNLWSVMVSTLAPISPATISSTINRDRGADEWGKGPPDFKPAVAQGIRGMYTRQLAASLARVMPRYLVAKNQAVLREETRTQTSVNWPEPTAKDVVPSNPLDRYVINALCGGLVQVDLLRYRKDNPDEAVQHEIKKLRPVSFVFQVSAGLWNWIRVTNPPDATPEEVAKELYGDAAYAYLIIPAAPLFGFRVGENVALRSPHDAEWKALVTDPSTPTSARETTKGDLVVTQSRSVEDKKAVKEGYYPLIDPVKEVLAGPQADEVALNQAKKLKPSGANRREIIQRMRLTVTIFDGLIKDANTFGLGKALVPARQRLDARSKALDKSTDPTEALKWDAHSLGQLSIVGSAAAGVSVAVQQFKSMRTSNQDKYGHGMLDAIRKPIYELARAYVEAAAASYLVGTARTLLHAADERSKMFPVEIMEGILAYLRSAIESASKDKTKVKESAGTSNEQLYHISEMRDREKKLRDELEKARETILKDPSKAQAILKSIQERVADLQTEVTMVTNMDAIDAAWRQLYDNLSVLGVFTGKNTKYSDKMHALNSWSNKWHEVYMEQRYGDKEKAKKGLKELQTDPKWVSLFNDIGKMIEDEETFEKWVAVGVMIGIAVITMGVGVYVEAAAGTAWGATAGFFAGAGAEAFTMTTLSTALLNRNPTLKGFILELGKNFAMFALFRLAGAGYQSAVGKAFAETTAGKGGQIMTMFLGASAAALVEARVAKGRELTEGEVYDILLQNAVVLAGTTIGARVARPFLEGIRVRGTDLGNQIREINAARAETQKLARTVTTSKDIKLARELVAKDEAVIEKEQEVLKKLDESTTDPDPAKAAEKARKAGLTPDDAKRVAELRAESEAALKDRKYAAVMLEMEPTSSPHDFLCESGKLDMIIKHHEEIGNAVSGPQVDPVTKARTVTVTPKEGPPFRITEKVTATEEGIIARPAEEAEPLPVSEPGTSKQYKTMDDIVKPDGFKDAELDKAYQNYKRSKGDAALGPEEWARAQTSGRPRKWLESELGPDYARRGRGPGRKLRLADIGKPEAYPEEQVAQGLAMLNRSRAKVFERLGRLEKSGIQDGEVNAGQFNILKGNIAEVLSGEIQTDVLAQIQKQTPGAELVSGVRVRIMGENGVLGPPKLFTDNLIVSQKGSDIVIEAKFEVKSGPQGGAEATSQVFEWVEGRLTEGSVLIIPGKGEFVWHPSGAKVPTVKGMAAAQGHIITPRGAEHLGAGSGEQTVKPVERYALRQTASEIEYLARLMLESLPQSTSSK